MIAKHVPAHRLLSPWACPPPPPHPGSFDGWRIRCRLRSQQAGTHLLEPPDFSAARLPPDAEPVPLSIRSDEPPHEGKHVEGDIDRNNKQRNVLLREHKGMPVRMIGLIPGRYEPIVHLHDGVPRAEECGSPAVLYLGKHPIVITEPHTNHPLDDPREQEEREPHIDLLLITRL